MKLIQKRYAFQLLEYQNRIQKSFFRYVCILLMTYYFHNRALFYLFNFCQFLHLISGSGID